MTGVINKSPNFNPRFIRLINELQITEFNQSSIAWKADVLIDLQQIPKELFDKTLQFAFSELNMDLIEDVLTQLEALDLMDDKKQLIIQLMQDRLDCVESLLSDQLGKRTSKLISQCKLRKLKTKKKHYVGFTEAWVNCNQSFWNSTRLLMTLIHSLSTLGSLETKLLSWKIVG